MSSATQRLFNNGLTYQNVSDNLEIINFSRERKAKR